MGRLTVQYSGADNQGQYTPRPEGRTWGAIVETWRPRSSRNEL